MSLMILMDKLINSLDNGNCVIGVFFISRRRLISLNMIFYYKKMEFYGIRGSAFSWFQSYVKNRKQFVSYNGATSSSKLVKWGVPQGFILGLLLFWFILMTYQMCVLVLIQFFFAEDTNLIINGEDILYSMMYLTRNLLVYLNDSKSINYLLTLKKHNSWCSLGGKLLPPNRY